MKSSRKHAFRSFFRPDTAGSGPACLAAAAWLKDGNPMEIDDVAVFPRHADHHGASVVPVAGRSALRLHAQAAGLHRSFGLVAEVFSPTLIQYANTMLKHKMLFGSDYPLIAPDRWFADSRRSAAATRCARSS